MLSAVGASLDVSREAEDAKETEDKVDEADEVSEISKEVSNLESKTKEELLSMAEELEVDIPSNAKKQEIIDLINSKE